MQPAQQQGLRFPSISSKRALSMCCFLVSGFLTEVTQQIHSLRARGVREFHLARAFLSGVNAFRKSAGNLCAVPDEIDFLAMIIILVGSLLNVINC